MINKDKIHKLTAKNKELNSKKKKNIQFYDILRNKNFILSNVKYFNYKSKVKNV